MNQFAILLYWIRERERIRVLKEAGSPRPWTRDPILHEWRFCNVNRCDDTVTRWVFRHIIAEHRYSSSLWFNLVIARLVNWPDSLAALGYFEEWDRERFVRVLTSIPGKVWTGAYMIPAGPSGVEKAAHLADATLSPLWARRNDVPQDGLCVSWAIFLEKAQSMGGFLVNQIVTDMKYAPALETSTDRETFVIAGPGTQRGLNRLHGRPLDATWKRGHDAQALRELRTHLVSEEPAIAETMRDLNNLSNCMCEFDKYERVRLGEGKPRSRYVPALAAPTSNSCVGNFVRSGVVIR